MKKFFLFAVFALIVVLVCSIYFLIFEKENYIIKVEILNTTDKKDIGYKFAEILKKKNYEVFSIEMIENEDLDNTCIVDRKNKNMKYAKNIAQLFKCKNIFSFVDSTFNIDVTIIIGKDYENILKRSFFGKKGKNDR
ncbi:MAG: LytR C-terminal domain-containing protein [candidate division WOR-3 bacterium]